MRLAADIWPAFIDANQLENGDQFARRRARGGVLSISTANVQITRATGVLQEGFEPGDCVVIRVADTGDGMSSEVLAKAADLFFTTKHPREGTSLGLSMISGFARQSRGHLQIYSEVGHGTTVELYPPRALQDAIEVNIPVGIARAERAKQSSSLKTSKLLRSIVTDVLEELSYTVLPTRDARAAIHILKSSQPIHLMVSDVVLPQINGRKLAEVARAARPDLKELFVSGYAPDATLRGDFLDSGMDMLMKPFPLDALGAKVHLLIEQEDLSKSRKRRSQAASWSGWALT